MTSYSWFWFLMYLWNLNMQTATEQLQDILDCGMANGVMGSKYADPDYIENIWKPIKAKIQEEIYDVLDIWWFPAMTLLYYFGPWASIGLYILPGPLGFAAVLFAAMVPLSWIGWLPAVFMLGIGMFFLLGIPIGLAFMSVFFAFACFFAPLFGLFFMLFSLVFAIPIMIFGVIFFFIAIFMGIGAFFLFIPALLFAGFLFMVSFLWIIVMIWDIGFWIFAFLALWFPLNFGWIVAPFIFMLAIFFLWGPIAWLANLAFAFFAAVFPLGFLAAAAVLGLLSFGMGLFGLFGPATILFLVVVLAIPAWGIGLMAGLFAIACVMGGLVGAPLGFIGVFIFASMLPFLGTAVGSVVAFALVTLAVLSFLLALFGVPLLLTNGFNIFTGVSIGFSVKFSETMLKYSKYLLLLCPFTLDAL